MQSWSALPNKRWRASTPCLIVDARYEKVRGDGVIRSRAVLVAIGIDWEGRRRILGVELAGRESASSWREFLLGLKARGLRGVRLAISDDHAGLKRAIAEVLPEAAWQRCYVHFLRNAPDHLPRKASDDCLTELRWLYDLRSAAEAQLHLRAWLGKWTAKHPGLCAWVEESIEETWTFYRPFGCAQGARSPASTTNTSKAPISSNGSTRNSSAAPTSCASSPTRQAVCGSSAPWPANRTRNGSMAPSISTWLHCANPSNPP